MSTLAQYRARIPAHAAVSDALVTAVLADAVAAHTATAWGARYGEAMCYWAAHRVECTPGSGADGLTRDGQAPTVPEGAARRTGPVASVRTSDGTTERTVSYAALASPDDFQSTVYGRHYLTIRSSRAASAPTVVTVGS